MGAVGGGVWHFTKGTYNAPRGLTSRMAGGISVRKLVGRLRATRHAPRICSARFVDDVLCDGLRYRDLAQAVRFEAPRLGGSFAVWAGLFSAFDCTLVAIRKKASNLAVLGRIVARKEDEADATMALTGGSLEHNSIRGDYRGRAPGAQPPKVQTHHLTFISTGVERPDLPHAAPPQTRYGMASMGRSALMGGVLLVCTRNARNWAVHSALFAAPFPASEQTPVRTSALTREGPSRRRVSRASAS